MVALVFAPWCAAFFNHDARHKKRLDKTPWNPDSPHWTHRSLSDTRHCDSLVSSDLLHQYCRILFAQESSCKDVTVNYFAANGFGADR